MKLKKAGLNPNLVDSEDHIESNTAKGWLTKEQADEARKIIAEAKVEGEAQLKMPMIENIAKGRVQKFLTRSSSSATATRLLLLSGSPSRTRT